MSKHHRSEHSTSRRSPPAASTPAGAVRHIQAYCRFSRADGPDVERQDFSFRCHVSDLAGTSVRSFAEQGSAPSLKHRPELSELLAMCGRGDVIDIVFEDHDRWTREPFDVQTLLSAFDRAGIRLHDPAEGRVAMERDAFRNSRADAERKRRADLIASGLQLLNGKRGLRRG